MPDIAPALLPWHTTQWGVLEGMLENGRVAHALLLRGPRGHGKHQFAERAANALVCEADAGRPCGTCRGCRLFGAGSHPEVIRVSPLEDKKAIAVEQIRELIAAVSLTRQHAAYKVVVLTPAELLTMTAANTLLKTLEEPPGDAVFLLVAGQSALLPATIRSRCQHMDFPTPPVQQATAWLGDKLGSAKDASTLLALAGGAPLAALSLKERGAEGDRAALFRDLESIASGRESPVPVAGRWKGRAGTEVIEGLVALAADLIRLRLAAAPPRLGHEALREPMQRLANGLDLYQLYALRDRCIDALRARERLLNLNEQLVLEAIAIGWAGARTRGPVDSQR